ncbi:MAG TPA: STAS/SEC14 domain-containing protein [Burkholderiales bacterium]|nr:STAS/SEC14 domain-containing protein [Burkholderiales bacterium]
MITIQHEGSLTVVGIFARLDIADLKRLEEEIESQLRVLGKIDLLVDLRGMLGYTLDVAFEDIRFTRAHAHDVGRIAILSEDDAVIWMALLSELFVRARIQVFDDETLAREWLRPEKAAEKR